MSDKLQKLLAHAGHGSRREIEKWISAGRVSLNGKRAKLGDRATAEDRILLDGKLVALTSGRSEQIKALIYHKPEGQICTRKDPKGRPTVFDYLPDIPNGRWVSVGRLDINTSGLLLFTNNGELANKLMHPSTGLEREYLVRIRGRATEETIQRLTREGVSVDGKTARFDSVMQADMSDEGSNHWYKVIIREGRYREVRKLWDAVGHTVSRLKRIRYGTVKLTRDLKQGKATKMAPMQLEKMITSAGLQDEFAPQLYSGLRQSRAKKSAAIKTEKTNIKEKSAKKTAKKVFRKAKKTDFERTMESGTGSKKTKRPSRHRK
ncbi:MAG: rRNA pseudouridine synthase [Gammaproteobacteria bacterium]|nr:rRNA pseudouridine synthase [Gammaproteobacteria bacterium]